MSNLTYALSYRSHAGNWVCRPCRNQEECDEDPKQFCVYGETRDSCGRRVCAKVRFSFASYMNYYYYYYQEI